MKRIIFLLTVLMLFVFSLTSCTSKNEAKMTVEGISVKEGVYNYYLDEASKEAESDGKAEETALQKCKEFAAAQLLLKEKELSVRAYFKRKTAEDTEALWNMFGEHYLQNGISKADINSVIFTQYVKKELLHYYYGTDGVTPVSVMDLKEEFVDLYIGFKAIEGSLTKENEMGETVALSDAEVTALKKKFSSMASQINNQTATIDELNESYNEAEGLIVTDTLPVILAKKDDGLYEESFFDAVMDIPHGFARVVQSGTSIYVVERAVIATNDEDAFAQYSEEILEYMKMDSINKMITKRADKCTVKED